MFASEGVLSIEVVKCSVKVHIQKSPYQSTDAIQICLRYIYEITMKLGEDTKDFLIAFVVCLRIKAVLKF